MVTSRMCQVTEQEGHDYRRKSASFRRRQLKSRGCDGEIRRTLSRVKRGTLSSSEFFDPTGAKEGEYSV
jgi:hypothetical protein